MRFRNLVAATMVFSFAFHANAGDWILDQKNCKVWNPDPEPGESISWSGSCKDGFANGKGALIWLKDGQETGNKYAGPMRGGRTSGKGAYSFANGDRYEGDYIDGKATGKGAYAWANGDRYEGGFADGKATGKGTFTRANGERYAGDFAYGKRTGKGTYNWPNGDRYEGDFVAGKKMGMGIYTWANGDRYEGDYVAEKRTGNGTYTWVNGNRYQGAFTDDKRAGKGVLTYSNGAIEQGIWNGDILVERTQPLVQSAQSNSVASSAKVSVDSDYRSKREEIEDQRTSYLRCIDKCTDNLAACGAVSIVGSLASLAAGAPVTSNVSACEGLSARCEANCASQYGTEDDYQTAMRDLDRSQQHAEQERRDNASNIALHQGARDALRDAERYKETQRERQQLQQTEYQARVDSNNRQLLSNLGSPVQRNQQANPVRQQVTIPTVTADNTSGTTGSATNTSSSRTQSSIEEQRRKREAQNTCPRVDPRYIEATVKRKTGPSACGSGEYHLYLTNHFNVRVVCDFALEDRDGKWSSGRDGVGVGRRWSNPFYTCDGTGRYRFVCWAQPDWQSDMLCPTIDLRN